MKLQLGHPLELYGRDYESIPALKFAKSKAPTALVRGRLGQVIGGLTKSPQLWTAELLTYFKIVRGTL